MPENTNENFFFLGGGGGGYSLDVAACKESNVQWPGASGFCYKAGKFFPMFLLVS